MESLESITLKYWQSETEVNQLWDNFKRAERRMTMESSGSTKSQREARNHQIQDGINQVYKSADRLEGLFNELNGTPPEKAPETIDPPTPCMAELLNAMPDRLRSVADRILQLTAQIREIVI